MLNNDTCDLYILQSLWIKAGPHVQLMGGGEGQSNQGWVEVRMEDGQSIGGICDTGNVGPNEAGVICREAGFPLGTFILF